MVHVVKVEHVGKRQTYDIEVDHVDHQYYLTDGKLTSNSHAVSYALDSYMCAFLLTYWPEEWLCAYAETESTSNDKKRAKAMSEIKTFGYDLVKLDINYADDTWTILPDKKFMPSFQTCKGIGSKAIEEIVNMRPYRRPHDLLWNHDGTWRHTKFNKKALENLIRVGAFDSMDIVGDGKYFDNYHHMYATIIENWAILRKRDGMSRLDELTDELRGISPWTVDERVSMYIKLIGTLDADVIMSRSLRDNLRMQNVPSIDDIEEGETKITWAIVVNVTQKKTRNKKDYLMLTCQGMTGKQQRVFVWGWRPGSQQVHQFRPYLMELTYDDFGMKTMSWKVRELVEDA